MFEDRYFLDKAYYFYLIKYSNHKISFRRIINVENVAGTLKHKNQAIKH